MKNTFRKHERLCNKSSIESLFKKGHTIYTPPLSVKWLISSSEQLKESPCQVLLIAPKRLFKHATERNRRKRLLRESFRLQKHTLYDFLIEQNVQIFMSICYTNEQEISKEQLDGFLRLIFDKLATKISNKLAEK